jgi:hypothetical protein
MNTHKTVLTSAIAMALSLGMSVNTAHAAQITVAAPQTTSHNNFTALFGQGSEPNTLPSADGIGTGFGNDVAIVNNQVVYGFGAGANNLTVSWDGTVYTASSDIGSAANMTITNSETMYGHAWTMSNIQVFGPGSYSFLGNTSTVASGQLMAHMNWAWGTNIGVDIYQLWNTSTGGCFGDCTTQLYTLGSNPANHTFGTVWEWLSVDTVMPNGGFAGSNFNYNLHLAPVNLPAAVPLPAAIWLFGSGLMGLAAVMRRKKKA